MDSDEVRSPDPVIRERLIPENIITDDDYGGEIDWVNDHELSLAILTSKREYDEQQKSIIKCSKYENTIETLMKKAAEEENIKRELFFQKCEENAIQKKLLKEKKLNNIIKLLQRIATYDTNLNVLYKHITTFISNIDNDIIVNESDMVIVDKFIQEYYQRPLKAGRKSHFTEEEMVYFVNLFKLKSIVEDDLMIEEISSLNDCSADDQEYEYVYEDE